MGIGGGTHIKGAVTPDKVSTNTCQKEEEDHEESKRQGASVRRPTRETAHKDEEYACGKNIRYRLDEEWSAVRKE